MSAESKKRGVRGRSLQRLVSLLGCMARGHADVEWVRNIYGDEINMAGGMRSIWKCKRCGFYALQPELMAEKCIVHGCSNRRGHGVFVGDMCGPCNGYITTGKIGATDSFLGDMKREIDALRTKQANAGSSVTAGGAE